MTKDKSPALRLAFCSMMAALGVAIMWLSNIIPILSYVSAFLASLVLIPVLYEYGPAFSWMTWVVISILALLICTERDAAFLFLFIGYYPIVKPRIDRIQMKPIRIVLKLVLFTMVTGLILILLELLIGTSAEELFNYLLLFTVILFEVALVGFDRFYGRAVKVYERVRPALLRKIPRQ
ncbi:MAG: hypothetical protein K6C08_00735 [Oscillospiraceae bacterium]|nr:hypothetical protein [Oscillospiraceae bacterium]